jgi:group I intron endonuclease
MIGIYRITSPSGRVYIGQTWNSSKRFSYYRKARCLSQPILYNFILKYGAENHSIEIIHNLPHDVSQDIIDHYEKFYIDSYKDVGIKLMNIREGGSHGKHSQVSKERMRMNVPEKCLQILAEYNSR